jgi:hypothetical protein
VREKKRKREEKKRGEKERKREKKREEIRVTPPIIKIVPWLWHCCVFFLK